jgi:hypothetical protein
MPAESHGANRNTGVRSATDRTPIRNRMPASGAKNHRFAVLDGLRGLAALMVPGFHLAQQYDARGAFPMPGWCLNSFISGAASPSLSPKNSGCKAGDESQGFRACARKEALSSELSGNPGGDCARPAGVMIQHHLTCPAAVPPFPIVRDW